jgi:isopenicillin-N N-acyltransferase-like protein
VTPLCLEGMPRELGRAHGTALRQQIRTFLDDDLARLNRVMPRQNSLTTLEPQIAAYQREIAAAAPSLGEEIEGLAEGAGIAPSEAMLLQIRREVMGYSRFRTAGDCTTLCRRDQGGPVLAQTIDLNGNLEDQMVILRIAHRSSRRRVLLLSFTGLLGYLGLNSDGLAIGLNLVLGGTWRPGVPPYLAIRHLLDSSSDIDSCLDWLSRVPLASSRSLLLCDANRSVTVEICDGKLSVRDGTTLVHTNHFLSEDFVAMDQMNPFSRNSSVRRLDACVAQLDRLGCDAGPEDYMAVMSQEPICVPDTGNIGREKTVGAVVLLPRDGTLHVRRGNPAMARTETFRLDA